MVAIRVFAEGRQHPLGGLSEASWEEPSLHFETVITTDNSLLLGQPLPGPKLRRKLQDMVASECLQNIARQNIDRRTAAERLQKVARHGSHQRCHLTCSNISRQMHLGKIRCNRKAPHLRALTVQGGCCLQGGLALWAAAPNGLLGKL